MILFKKAKEKKFFNVFSEKYYKATDILLNTDIVLPYYTVEIIPLMYCIVDVCTSIANKNRDFVNKTFIAWSLLMLDEDDRETLLSIFDERSAFYAAVLNKEIKPRCDWNVSGPKATDNPIINCCAAFSDIVTNPFYAKDYSDETKISINLDDSAIFSKAFNKFCFIIAELYNETYKLL